jgi:hypothetical protein
MSKCLKTICFFLSFLAMKYLFKQIIFSTILLSFATISFAQQAELDEYNAQRVKISRGGLYNLAGWSALNFAVSGIGWATTEGATREFHRANVTWNMVNAGIAIPGLISSYRKSSAGLSLSDTHKEQRKAEGAYLINGILDASYMGIGLFLLERSKSTTKDANRMKGWGNALLLQGGFLLLTDIVMYSWQAAHANRKLGKIDHSIGFSGNGFGYVMRFN